MQSINSISEFLLSSGSEYLCFDMARGIVRLDTQVFFDYEQGKHPVARPRQQHGWFGLLFWNKQLSNEHYIWFVKLPVDERGCLVAAARMSFLQIIVEALGQQLEKAPDNQGQLPENPFSFVPSQQQLADFNSLVRQSLGKAPSQYFQPAMNYLHGRHNDWQSLSVQGIADLAAEIGGGKLDELITTRFGQLASPVTIALLHALENYPISSALSDFLIQQVTRDKTLALSVLRAIRQSEQEAKIHTFIVTLLNDEDICQSDLLQVVAGRHWLKLKHPTLRDKVMIKAAETGLFSPLFQDLVQIPDLRESMLELLRNPDNPPLVSQAIGEIFSSSAP